MTPSAFPLDSSSSVLSRSWKVDTTFVQHRKASWSSISRQQRRCLPMRAFLSWKGAVPNSGNTNFWQGGLGRPGRVTFYQSKRNTSQYKTLQEQIGAAGLSGVASYGLFNTLYYFFAFLVILFSLPKPTTITSASSAISHVFTLLAIVWAGSQVTKIPRAACALACVPLMDKFLGWIRQCLNLQNKREAFLYVLVPSCWLLFFSLLGISIAFLLLG